MLNTYFTRRRASILGFAIAATMATFGFLAVRRPAAQEVRPAAPQPGPDSLAPASVRNAAGQKTSFKADAVNYNAGEDPDYAAKMGWPVKGPEPGGDAILPTHRIVAYYGNPLSKKMGVLGEFETQEMLRRFDRAVAEWRKADPSTPVQPALHLIASVAQGEPGPSGKYRTIMRDSLIEMVYGWAKSRNAILFIDLQTGHSDIRELLPRFDQFLTRPDVHLAIDPEFAMLKSGKVPGTKIGTLDASDINFASAHLADLVRKNKLPAKVLIVHRFTRNMVTNARGIQLRPEVEVVMNMDGWGAPWLKRDSYKDYIVREPVQYTGFKLFYHNDTKKGEALLKPEEVLKLRPQPLYIQYQ